MKEQSFKNCWSVRKCSKGPNAKGRYTVSARKMNSDGSIGRFCREFNNLKERVEKGGIIKVVGSEIIIVRKTKK